MRFRTLLLFLLLLSPAFYLSAQHYPINGSSGWGIVDTNGQMIVPRNPQAFVYDPQLQFNNYLSIFLADDHFNLYRSRLAQLEQIDFDSLYFGISREATQKHRKSSQVFAWEGPILSASQYYQALPSKASPQNLVTMMFVKGDSYTLLDQNADTLYHGDIRPKLIANNDKGFIIIAGKKSGYWQTQPNVLVPVKYDKINLYMGKERGPACISLKEGADYHLLVGSLLKDSLQAKGNMRLLYDDRVAIQDATSSNWGVLNHLGDTIVPLQYDLNFSFLNDFTIVRKDKLEAVIDLEGKEVFPLKYKQVIPELNGTFWIKTKKGWALADGGGNLLTSLNFTKPGSFDGPVAVINASNKWGLINQYGEILAEPKYDAIQVLDNVARLRIKDDISQISFHKDGRHNPVKKLIINGSAEPAIKPAIDSISRIAPTVTANVWFKSKTKWGLRNNAGVVLPPRYDRIIQLSDLPFDLVVSKSPSGGDLYGFVDRKNVRLVLKPSLSHIAIQDFEDSQIARAILPNGYYVLVNSKGAVLRLDKVNYMEPIEDGHAIACKGAAPNKVSSLDTNPFDKKPKLKGQWGLMRSNGSWAIPPTFQQFESYHYDLATVKTNEKWGAIDRKNEFILAPQFDSLFRPFDHNNQRVSPWFCSVNNQSRQFFFNASGELLHIQQLQDYRIQADAYIIAQQNDLWGLLDSQGNWQIKPQYAALGDLNEGKIPFLNNKAWGYLNLQGEIVILPAYSSAMPFYEGKAAIRIGKKWGYIDSTANELSKIDYLKAYNFQDGVAIVKQDKYFGILNKDGKWALNPKYTKLERNEYGFVGIREGEKVYFKLDKVRLKLNPVSILPESNAQKTPQLADKVNRQQAYHHFVLNNFEEIKNGIQCGERSELLGLLDENGLEILPMEFEEIEYLGDLYRVLWRGRLGYYSANDRWIVKPEGYK